MSNPYETPLSNLEKDEQDSVTLATRGSRFLAALIDGLIGIAIAVPFWLLSGMWDFIAAGAQAPLIYMLAGGVYGFIGFVLVHYYFLNKNGQTVGKKLLKIRITGTDDQLKGAPQLLGKRYLPITIVSMIPLLGSLLMLINLLFIFRKDRRCVHDLIAGTKVVMC
ncbi:MAG: RDD family protein [Candidatus Thiodiazotropha sp. (ex Monitilora ramsayi)]|nr:RDD family protein [Candidatus Thiodiazotropha sp. (ex Monitilora ramsayi)]